MPLHCRFDNDVKLNFLWIFMFSIWQENTFKLRESEREKNLRNSLRPISLNRKIFKSICNSGNSFNPWLAKIDSNTWSSALAIGFGTGWVSIWVNRSSELLRKNRTLRSIFKLLMGKNRSYNKKYIFFRLQSADSMNLWLIAI